MNPMPQAASQDPSYTIRPAQVADLTRMEELLLDLQEHLETSNPDVWRKTPAARKQLRSQLASRLRAPDVCALVAEHADDGVVGVGFGRIVTNKRYEPARSGSIDQVFVDERYRRAGLGSRLVEELCHFFGKREITDLSLRYVVGNELAACFWEGLGFAPRITIAGAPRQTVEKRLAQTQAL